MGHHDNRDINIHGPSSRGQVADRLPTNKLPIRQMGQTGQIGLRWNSDDPRVMWGLGPHKVMRPDVVALSNQSPVELCEFGDTLVYVEEADCEVVYGSFCFFLLPWHLVIPATHHEVT